MGKSSIHGGLSIRQIRSAFHWLKMLTRGQTPGTEADLLMQLQLSHKMIPHDLHDVNFVRPDWVEDIDISHFHYNQVPLLYIQVL